ncbi:MAG: alpha/beta hydrolase, partial [Nanoarchaeota archaeon]|nr:alpha/beta hydrolase [Nanoarchaeota archaeon]
KWVETLKVRDPEILAISMGGPIAYYMIKAQPKRFRKVVFFAPWYNLRCVNYNRTLAALGKMAFNLGSKLPFSSLGDKVYRNESLMLAILRIISPKENFKDMPSMKKYIRNFSGFSFSAVSEAMSSVANTDLDQESMISRMKSVFIMSKRDTQLNYSMTLDGYRRLFPNIIELPLTHNFHAPRTWITKNLVESYFGKAFIEAAKL